MERKLGVAVVGLGIGEQHARTYARLDECELRWLYDLDGDRARRLARELGTGNVAESYDTILADGQVDIVSIASYDDAHAEQTIAAFNAKKHVFVEKPLCQSVTQLQAIAAARASHHHLQLSSNLVLRAAPLYRWLQTVVENEQLGQIYAIDGDYLYGRLHKITEGWRNCVDNYSVMQGGGIHLVDLMLRLARERPTTVTARGNRICSDGTAFRYNDYVCATFEFVSGLVGRVSANFGCVHRHQHVLRVFGTKGTAIYDDRGARLHTSQDPAILAAPLDLSPLPSSKGDLIPWFVESVRDRKPTTSNELDLMSVCIAADRALETQTSIAIEYL